MYLLYLCELRYGTQPEFERYKTDYIKLYIETIREVVSGEDPSRPFVSSSPSNGAETERQGWVANNPQNPLYGDGKNNPLF